MSELVGKLSQGVEYYKGDPGPKGDIGPRGPQGEPFRYEDFTPEQLESLRGPKGDAFTYKDFTQEQLDALKGPQGDTYILTEADKTEIANMVMDGIPTAEEVEW